jgi:hypothetical protein
MHGFIFYHNSSDNRRRSAAPREDHGLISALIVGMSDLVQEYT